MEWRAKKITETIKTHDRELYCARHNGILCVFRKTYRYERYVFEGDTYISAHDAPYFVFSLTDNWATTGKPVDWGLEPIMTRLKAIDLWRNPKMVEELIESYDKAEESRKRDKRNNIESFFYDYRRQFAKTFDHINTSTLAKKDRRRTDEQKLKLRS